METEGPLSCSQGSATDPYLSQMHPIQIHSNNIFPSIPRSSKRPILFTFFKQNILCISHVSHSCYMPCLVSSSSINWQ